MGITESGKKFSPAGMWWGVGGRKGSKPREEAKKVNRGDRIKASVVTEGI